MRISTFITILGVCLSTSVAIAAENVIERQLKEIGTIPNEEVIVVQRQYTSKKWRWELTPITFGGVPFGTVRKTLFGGTSATLHLNDWFAWEMANFTYTKTFFSSFTDDINNNKLNSNQANIKPDFQKLLYFLTTGVQVTPFYGKLSTFSRWIAYIEPYFSAGAGLAKTEVRQYFTFYPGIGVRIYFREWFSMKVEFRDYLYTEKFTPRTDSPTEQSALRNNYAVNVAFSFWLPKMPR